MPPSASRNLDELERFCDRVAQQAADRGLTEDELATLEDDR